MTSFRRPVSASPSPTLPPQTVELEDVAGPVPADALPARVQRLDFGGALTAAVPALSVPYLAVQQAAPLRFDDLKQQLSTKSEENLGKALKAGDDLWNEQLKNLNILPEFKRQLNLKRAKFQTELHRKVLENPGYFNSQANLMEVSQGMQNLVFSPDIDAYKRATKDIEERAAQVQAKNLENNPLRNLRGELHQDAHGYSGLSQKQYLDLVQRQSGDNVAQLLGIDQQQPAGQLDAGNWVGTDLDLEHELDGWSQLAHASSWKKGQGGFHMEGLTPDQQKAFGTKYASIVNYQQAAGGTSNARALDLIAAGVGGKNWRQMLAKPAVQALTDKMYQNYQQMSFGQLFDKVPLVTKSGQTLPSSGTVAEVATAARQGLLKDSAHLLALIDQNRERVIDRSAQHYILQRIGAGKFSESEQESKQGIELIGAGQADKDKPSTIGPESAERDNMGNVVATQVPTAYGNQPGQPSLANYYTIAPPLEVVKNRKTLYEPSDRAPTVAAAAMGRRLLLPALPGQNAFQQFGLPGTASDNLSSDGILGMMRVQAYHGDAKNPALTSAGVRQLEQELQTKLGRIETAQKVNQHYKRAKDDGLAPALAEVAALRQQLGQAVDAEKTPVLHRLNVVMRQQDFSRIGDRFQAYDRDGKLSGPYGHRFGSPSGSWDWLSRPVDIDFDNPTKQGTTNIHNVRRFTADEAELKRLGYSASDPLVQFEMMVEAGSQDRFNDGHAGAGARIDKDMQDQRRGELNQNLNAAQPW